MLQNRVLGTPSPSDWGMVESLRHFQAKFPKFTKKPWVQKHQTLQSVGPHAVDLIDKLVRLNPEDRITCDEALKHPFLSSYNLSSSTSL